MNTAIVNAAMSGTINTPQMSAPPAPETSTIQVASEIHDLANRVTYKIRQLKSGIYGSEPEKAAEAKHMLETLNGIINSTGATLLEADNMLSDLLGRLGIDC